MANQVGKDSYATYEILDSLSYLCIKYLMENNELVWKLLKYPTADAWTRPDLTMEEKASLVYSGQDDSSLYNVFMDTGLPDVFTREDCILRIQDYTLYPDNRVVGNVSMIFEAHSHFKCNHLSDYKIRTTVIMKNILQTLNGVNIGGVGKLFFDRMGSYDNRMEIGGQIPYKSRWLLMSNKVK